MRPERFGAVEFAAKAPIHPDSLEDYKGWQRLLQKWNPRINLVAPGTLKDFWWRHALDSAQILPLISEDANTIVDFGSGAGFPGLAVAFDAKKRFPDRTVHLIESVGKKTSFLKTVSRETSTPVTIHTDRIEDIVSLSADILTARAFAPLTRLLPLAHMHLKEGGMLILLKGETLDDEIKDVSSQWSFDIKTLPSATEEGAFIAVIRNLRPL